MSNMNRSERTHRDILDAAWTLIAEKGAEVSMAEIAKAVGITRQSIYVHFGSRGGLLVALVRRADEREKIWEGFDRALSVEPVRDRLDACLKVWFEFVPRIYPVARDLIRLKSRDAEADKAWQDRMAELLGLFRRLIRELQQNGILAPHWTVARAADFLWAGCSVQAWELLVKERGWSHGAASKAIRETMGLALLTSSQPA